MKVHLLKPTGSVIAVAIALVVGLEAPAMAHQVSVAAHEISGSSIKPNTVTGKQVKESTLATVPSAKLAETLPKLVWHEVTKFDNGWGNYSSISARPVAYAVDAQGIVHLRGDLTGGTANDEAFALPASLSSGTVSLDIPIIASGGAATDIRVVAGGVYIEQGAVTADVSSFTSLEGVSFAKS